MSLLVEQVPADERRFHELQQAALRVRAGMAGRFRTLGADLFEWREPAADAPLHVQIQALPLAKACFQSPAISVGTWIGGELGATERFIESCWHLIILKMMRLHEKGPFHQDPGSDELTALKQAAESRDRREFARLARTINWVHYPPTELVQAIDVALALDMIQVARELARKGQNLFPRNERIQRAAGVLSPPFFMRTRPSQTGAF